MARGEGGGLSAGAPPALATEVGRRAARGRAARRSWIGTGGLLGAPVLWLLLFFVIPLFIVAAYSVGGLTLFANQQPVVSFSDWGRFLTGESVYMSLFWKSIRLSLMVSAIVVVLAYPVGYFLALVASKRKYVLLLVIIAPFLTSFLLRILAWRVILGAEGVVNTLLFSTGLREQGDPVQWLIYGQFAVGLVLVYAWVPFVALPIFVTLENLDRSVLEAGSDLGASRWKAFWRVTFPISLPGVAAGFVFVFIPTIGEFVTPSLVGGTDGLMYGNAITELFLKGLDWQTGSVLALFLVGVVAVLMAVSARWLKVNAVEPV